MNRLSYDIFVGDKHLVLEWIEVRFLINYPELINDGIAGQVISTPSHRPATVVTYFPMVWCNFRCQTLVEPAVDLHEYFIKAWDFPQERNDI